MLGKTYPSRSLEDGWPRSLYGKVAIPYYDKAIELDPDYPDAYRFRGIAYRKLGQYAKADANEAKACRLDKKYR